MKRNVTIVSSTLSFALAVIFLLAAASAQAKGLPTNYAALKLGGYFPQSGDLTNDPNGSFGSGFNGELALGTYLAPGAILEGTVGYFNTKGSGNVPGFGAVSDEFRVIPIQLSIKGQAFFDKFEPFAEAGVGVYRIKDEFKVAGVTAKESDTRLGLHIGAGGNINLSRNIFVGVEGKYLWVKANTFGVNTRLDGVTLTANVGYRF